MSALNHAVLPVDNGPDGVVLVDGQPAREAPNRRVGPDPFIAADAEIDGDLARVYVHYDAGGIDRVRVAWQGGLEATLEEAEPQPDDHYRYELDDLGMEATVEIVPETEVRDR